MNPEHDAQRVRLSPYSPCRIFLRQLLLKPLPRNKPLDSIEEELSPGFPHFYIVFSFGKDQLAHDSASESSRRVILTEFERFSEVS